MKREHTSSANNSVTPPSSPVEPTTPPPTSKKAKSTPKSSEKKPKVIAADNGEWTPEKRETFMDRVIAAGYKAINIPELALELGMKNQQLHNQLALSRKGSLRDKAVKAAKGG